MLLTSGNRKGNTLKDLLNRPPGQYTTRLYRPVHWRPVHCRYEGVQRLLLMSGNREREYTGGCLLNLRDRLWGREGEYTDTVRVVYSGCGMNGAGAGAGQVTHTLAGWVSPGASGLASAPGWARPGSHSAKPGGAVVPLAASGQASRAVVYTTRLHAPVYEDVVHCIMGRVENPNATEVARMALWLLVGLLLGLATATQFAGPHFGHHFFHHHDTHFEDD